MGHAYRAVGWNRQKRVYDVTLAVGIVLYIAAFVGIGFTLHPEATAEAMLIRAFGTGAFLLLHVVLSIGPLARLDRRFLPLLYNRRHLGVATFLLGFLHGAFSLVQFHALGDLNPLVSLFVSNTRFDSIAQFPFQPLGAFALVVLFLMAATSHDFWLANLTAPVWKALHMLVYLAYVALVGHVALGVLQAETSPLFVGAVGLGAVVLGVLHLLAARREASTDRSPGASKGLVEVCAVDDIPENRAKLATIAGDRVAIFRYDGQVSAVSNACQHQNGPLGEGCVIDGLITCPWHGYQYRPLDGASPEPFTEQVPTFRVEVREGRVWVDPRPLPAGTAVEPARVDGSGPARDEPFYVGYLPQAPAALARWVRTRVAALFLLGLGTAALVATAQKPFGNGIFEFGDVRAFEGWIEAEPYPQLLVERPGGGVSSYLMSAFGKFGADAEVAAFDGRRVRLEGTLVYRDGQTMVEVVGESVEAIDGASAAPALGVEALGERTLVGEIVDSKCYLGVMKPGATKPHRACATRCISGGVPPVLLVRDGEGLATYFLLVDETGGAVGREVVDRGLVAEPVRVTGAVERLGERLVLRADPATIERVGS